MLLIGGGLLVLLSVPIVRALGLRRAKEGIWPLPEPHRTPAEGAHTFEHAAVVRLVGGVEPLRDDYAPVDQLETRP